MDNAITNEVALTILFTAAQSSRLTAQEHENVKVAAKTLQNYLQNDKKGLKKTKKKKAQSK